jgi:hypothetical protein
MQEKMQNNMNQYQNQQKPAPSSPVEKPEKKEGDYIDFEEVK